MDWPLSEAQEQLPAGTQHTAYFTPEFNSKLTDLERLEVLVDKYRTDSASEQPGGPLRLLMGYVYATDKPVTKPARTRPPRPRRFTTSTKRSSSVSAKSPTFFNNTCIRRPAMRSMFC